MESAQQYLERCLDVLKSQQVSETTMIIMFHEYAKLCMREYGTNQTNNNTKKQEYPYYGC